MVLGSLVSPPLIMPHGCGFVSGRKNIYLTSGLVTKQNNTKVSNQKAMATTEQTINDALAGLLMDTRSLWRYKGVVKSENVNVLKSRGKKPDILITEPNVSPVIVETEIMPATSVELDARQRLGEHLSPSAKRILSSVAIRLPTRLKNLSVQPLKDEILNASDFDMALYTGGNPESLRRDLLP